MARLKRRLPWLITDKLTIGSVSLTEESAAIVAVADLDTLDATVAELNTLADVTAGTVAASKAVVVNASKNIGTFGTVTAASFVGNVDGNLVGQHRHEVEELTETGAITITSGVVLLNHVTTPIKATLATPTAGDELYIINSSATGTAAHTVTCAEGVTFDGTNDVATFDFLGEALHLIAISATRWFILENIGTIVLSESAG